MHNKEAQKPADKHESIKVYAHLGLCETLNKTPQSIPER